MPAAFRFSLFPFLLGLLLCVGCPTDEPVDDDDDTATDDDDDTVGDDDDAVPPWPEWAMHHWVWEDESTQESATALVDDYLARDIPVGAIIIDSPWETGYNTFEWDTDRFPDPQGMIDHFHDNDVRVFMWIVPAINVDVQPLYDEAAALGYFMQTSADSGPAVVDWWKGEGSLIDYFNPEAVAWWHELMDPMFDMDIDGWKTDGLDFGAIIANYSPGLGEEVERLDYSHAYYRDFFEYTREKLGDDRLITARPIDNYGADIGGDAVAFAPIDINWAAWVGDQDATFEGIQAVMRNFYWSADYGYTVFGSDIGGYRDTDGVPQGRTKEVFLRWAQLGTFSGVMENGGGGEHRPWEWDTETETVYRGLVEMRYAMLPYLMEEGAIAYEAGESLMQFSGNAEYDYMFGRDIYVAPIIVEGNTRTCDFPDGANWVWLFGDHAVFEGGAEQTLDFPLDTYPAFVREGSEIAETLLP